MSQETRDGRASLPIPLSISISSWFGRVGRYVERDSEGRAIRALDDPVEGNPRARCAIEGAKSLCRAGGVSIDGSSPACRTFWRLWARDTLAEEGLVALNGSDIELYLPVQTPEESSWLFALQGRHARTAAIRGPLLRAQAAQLAKRVRDFPPGYGLALCGPARSSLHDARRCQNRRGEGRRSSL